MNVLLRAACAATLIVATLIVVGCGETFRQVATPNPVPSGNPSGAETDVVLNQCPGGMICSGVGPAPMPNPSVITAIDVSGDTNAGNKPLDNQVGSVVGPVAGSLAAPIALDAARTSVFTANTSTDTVTKLALGSSTAGVAANTTTLVLPTGAAPVGISFEYFGSVYNQDYVVNAGSNTAVWMATCPNGGGALTAISQVTNKLAGTVCLGANSNPVAAWIFKDQTKVFVLDFNLSLVYVVDAATLKLHANPIALPAGSGPFKVSQSSDGLFLYVLNSNRTISIINGELETLAGNPLGTPVPTDNAPPLTSALPIDIAQNTNFNDTSANTQFNHVWILHADGTVSVFDATTPGQLSWITSLATGANPTNLALLRDGSRAYVGLGGSQQIVGIDTTKLAEQGNITVGATTLITLDVLVGSVSHSNRSQTLNDTAGNPHTVLVESTTPVVNNVAVSRQGNSADLSKVYASHTTQTTYYCYDANVVTTSCTSPDPWDGTASFLVAGCTDLGSVVDPLDATKNLFAMSCPSLFNGTAVVSAADINGGSAGLNVPINTQITTILAPAVVANCNPGNRYDGQKNCPAMIPVMVLGRS